MGGLDGDGEVQIPSRRRRFGSSGPWCWTSRRPSSNHVVWAKATNFSFAREILRVFCGHFEQQRRVQLEGCVAEPLRTITAILPGSNWSCLLRIVLQDALSELTKFYPPLKLRVFVDDTSALLMERTR